jgi:hypothetical protein
LLSLRRRFVAALRGGSPSFTVVNYHPRLVS